MDNQELKNNGSRKLIIFEIVCVILMITLIGYTYSYFNVTATNDTVITGQAASLSLNLTVTKVAPSNNNGLVPQLDSAITNAVIGRNGSCIDDNNNSVCQVYQITVKNTSNASIKVDGVVELNSNANSNLKWARISSPTDSVSLLSNANSYSYTTLTANETYNANEIKNYYIVVWISETGVAQSDTGNFTGVVRFNDSEEISPASTTLYTLGIVPKKDNLTTFTTTSKLDGTTGIYASDDDLGTSYYFRGNMTNNYVSFAGFYWRIIRINGDGSIRMIYDGTRAHANSEESEDRIIGASAYNTNYADNAFVGYMNGTTDGTNFPNGTTNSISYQEAHTNTTNSTIKTVVDNWYKTNIVDAGYSGSVVDAIYCNDRTRVTDEAVNAAVNATGEGFGTNVTLYSLYGRMTLTAEGNPENFTPTLKCNQGNDKFTVSEDLGNGDLTYPVGLLTIDEMIFGGSYLYMGDTFINDETYLFTGGIYYWTMSPDGFYGGSANVIIGDGGAVLNSYVVNFSDFGVRPVISLSSSAIIGGTGTSTDPFIVS